MKKQSRPRRPRTLGQVESLETRALLTIAATTPLPDVSATAGAAAATVDLTTHFDDSSGASNFALFNTSLGTIPVLLTPSTTPQTVANFESYVNKGAYANSIVHRSVPGFVWQAGGYQLSSTNSITTTATDSPVQNEFSASNVRGTIAMAKMGGDPNSATSQFFFNESDSNASNLDNQNGGFTVFGHVVGDSGLAVMDAVSNVPVPSSSTLSSPLDSAPLLNYTAGSTVQGSNLVLIKNVTMANEAFSAASDTPTVATASLDGNNLVVTPVSAGTAKITVVGYGSDGSTATESFVVNVAAVSQTTDVAATSTVADTSATTTSTTTSSSTTAATPTSDVTATARGMIPSSAIAGWWLKLQTQVTLTAASGPVSQKERVQLVLSPTSGVGEDVTIASTTANVRLKAAGKQTRVNLGARRLVKTVPAGTYQVLITVTDPDGAKSVINTGQTMEVQSIT
ncbi:peptidylprolyl isomerase [Paludisphaera rhizosphaerae]|uniref:peptidylprolyl isomerase n=1 Tax=Paludisphaera rhizosphaerae TaxID=2711216 RepID=UPI001F0D4992|nr:peptidylprolyl isomerase [Paludisphaera rhizosphaerae]